MKNKSKLKKVQKKKAQSPSEWLYLNPEEVGLRSVYEIFGREKHWRAELWEEAGVLEIGIPEAGSVDLERMDTDLGDEEGNAYLEKHQIKTVFAVTIVPEDYEKAHMVMMEIMKSRGGFFCGDTEDFQPEIRLSEQK